MKSKELSIFSQLDGLTTDYETGKLERIDGLYRSQYKVIRMCEFYSNSRYMSKNQIGEYSNTDGLGRDKPFYNIVNYRVGLAKTATDLDIKDIQITSDNPEHQVESMLLNREVYEWMKSENFSLTLNQMGGIRPKYGGYLIKKTEKDGKLKIDVVDWTKVYTDQSDILSGAIIEKHFMTPVDLKNKDGVWDNVDVVLKANKVLKLKSNRIKVFEITGEFSKATYNNAEGEDSKPEDEFTFSLQKYYIADIDGKKYKLFCEELSGVMTDYYEYLAWEDSGFALGRGVIEDSEEAQVWTNDSVINEKNAMDLAGKVVLKTTSRRLANNILEVDNGKIFELGPNEDVSSFNLAPAALGQFQNQIDKWKMQANDVTNSYDATTGKQPPADTPYSQTALLNQIGMKPFDYKREEWGIHLTTIFNNWVIPYLVKKIKKEHILVSEFTEDELNQIDAAFAISQANDDLIKRVLGGEKYSKQLQTGLQTGYLAHIKKQGKKRYLTVPDDFFSDIEAKVTVITTGEQKNKSVMLQSLSTILDTVIKSYNPNTGKFGVLEDPILSKIFASILEISGAGISPISLGIGLYKPPQQSTAPAPSQNPAQPAPTQSPLKVLGVSNPLATNTQ